METTTIQVDSKVRDLLRSFGRKGETYNDIILKLIERANCQWNLLVENKATNSVGMVQAAKAAIGSFARSLVKRKSQIVFAFDKAANIVMKTSVIKIKNIEKEFIKQLYQKKETDLVEPVLDGKIRVAIGVFFEPFKWYFLITEEKDAF